LVTRRQCLGKRADGKQCGMPPLLDSDFCWAHDKENAEAAAEARRIGGLRRRREATLAGAYDLSGLDLVDGLRRVLDIALVDSLNLDNGMPRNRTLIAIVMVGLKALATGELADRVEALEAIVKRQGPQPSVFTADDDLAEGG
jgi:hypothetical protein